MLHLPSPMRRAVVAPVLVAIAACGGDGATAPEANLTPTEAAEVLEALSVVSSLSFGAFPVIREYTGEMPALTSTLDESAPCPQGGTTRIRGSVTVNETTGAGSADLRQTYSNCGVTSDTERTWVFNGDPDIRTRFTYGYNLVTEQLTFSGTQTGAIRFSSNGTTGRCSINLSINIGETAITISGRVCGQTVSESVPFTTPL